MFRDPNAWYHLVFVWDNLNATSADKMKLYINGERITGTGGIAYTAPTTNSRWNMNNNTEIGARHSGADRFFTGVMAHVHNCDGYAYQASDFGETDSTSGAWVAKTSPSVSYGTNGFFLKFASGATGTDSSGQSNNFTTAGTMTTTKDTPDNNYCNINELDNYYAGATLSNGNNTMVANANNSAWLRGSMSVTKGLWYWETLVSGGLGSTLGIAATGATATSSTGANNACTYAYMGNDGTIKRQNSGTAYGATYTTGDYVGTYLDLDNNKIYFSKNGVLQNKTGSDAIGHTILAPDAIREYTDSKFIYPNALQVKMVELHLLTYTWSFNFGNGYFGTTAVAYRYRLTQMTGWRRVLLNMMFQVDLTGSAKSFSSIMYC